MQLSENAIKLSTSKCIISIDIILKDSLKLQLERCQMVMFIIGCFVGTFFGIAIMCLVQYNNIGDTVEQKAEINHLAQSDPPPESVPISTSNSDNNWQKLF